MHLTGLTLRELNLRHIQISPQADSQVAAENQQPAQKIHHTEASQKSSDERRSEASHSRMSNQIQLGWSSVSISVIFYGQYCAYRYASKAFSA